MAKPEKNNKEKKHFFKDFKTELKRVNWPTAKQLVNNTTAVITIVLLTAIIVFVLDFAFESLNTYGINKLRNLVQKENTTQQDVENGSEENNEEIVEDTDTTNNENTENVETSQDENEDNTIVEE